MKYTEHDALRLPLATIPNIDALSPTTKRKHDVNVAEACLSGKEGGGEASFETGTPAKRLKHAGPSRAKSLKHVRFSHTASLYRFIDNLGHIDR